MCRRWKLRTQRESVVHSECMRVCMWVGCNSLEVAKAGDVLVACMDLGVRVHFVEVGEPPTAQEALSRLCAVSRSARARLLVAVTEQVAADVRAVVAHLRKRLVAETALVGLVSRVHPRVNIEFALVTKSLAANGDVREGSGGEAESVNVSCRFVAMVNAAAKQVRG
jgi:hypothetical protein